MGLALFAGLPIAIKTLNCKIRFIMSKASEGKFRLGKQVFMISARNTSNGQEIVRSCELDEKAILDALYEREPSILPVIAIVAMIKDDPTLLNSLAPGLSRISGRPDSGNTPAPPNSIATGTTGGASAPAGTATGGVANGKSAKASYIVRPIAAYPPESRAAGEHGVVILRLTLDGSGRPTAVSVTKGSGFPRLDRAAVEAGWRCRVRDAIAGSNLDAPVSFSLSDR